MKKILLTTTALIALGIAPAAAADLAARPYTKAPAAIAINNWSGFYLGAMGGYAWADNRITATALGVSISDSQVHSGWTAGAGVEVMFAPKWSVKAEYLYRSFQGETYFSGIVPGGLPTGTLNLNSVQVGVNYHF